ncbi:dihydropteroate synthase [Aneurinibacillus aneurinilyticus]|jgi:dihydropteroate synthase|uniref:Dihydropteroate synthase n=2 Tax=Aneurinibacillus aneurinilyticus TaxID=1391 RepID=A0A848D200_ANEAE|nr:dihydropteroate synthase [Aneurinibacillus aneurinilyticus]ERI08741.1 dihydropteroate synthase [Aneurinibacillus aneurinilyticus ATCC 12856]MCI1695309.1 dihydropteroate synthase [Aneurinibacillus aneurinilyticus]MED0706859.1 dihydropteroate synthase [Aneurinibacillus aneurinilyticus]MED0723362.1 dihydropteroate synthase [Aneurinibacillus aneurinilyticus]MED0733503.1 dihydropteroate synthase [Aneurinibacillus aneurinilyticus]
MQQGIQAGSYELPVHQRTLVMGILNITPDSFSDGGHHHTLERALEHARRMVKDGADIIDIGGESTRPGHDPVSVEEELERVIPIIERLTDEIDIPLSIDTYKAEVARQAVHAGARIINDIWGGKADAMMPKVMAESGLPVILMHNRDNKQYTNFVNDVLNDINECIDLVKEAGVEHNNIILDPGIGFAKTYKHNLEMMYHMDKLVSLGYPVLLGTSRKMFIGKALGDMPVTERMEGTAATVALGVERGCRIVRVHDVKPIVRVCRMMDAMLYGWQQQKE